jgi:hypothetical protein
VLEAACCEPTWPHASLGHLDVDPRTLEQLWEAWTAVQHEHWPDLEQLDAETELQLAEVEADGERAAAARDAGYPPPPAGEAPLAIEARAAVIARSPVEFFGAPISELSDAQLAYYLTLRAVHDRTHSDDARNRCVSLRELRRKAGR